MFGRFLTIEGGDGAGKSSHIAPMAEHLRSYGYTVVVSREPGGTPIGEEIRKVIFLDDMHWRCEALLFAASRSQHVEQLIKPRLKEGCVVISDRFADSSYAYQGTGRGHEAEVLQLEEFVLGGFQPDYTLFFDVSLETSIKRLAWRSASDTSQDNRLDRELIAFKQRVFDGYQQRLLKHADRIVRIDAEPDLMTVRANLIDWLDQHFIPNNPLKDIQP
jgi:dTMP kinase